MRLSIQVTLIITICRMLLTGCAVYEERVEGVIAVSEPDRFAAETVVYAEHAGVKLEADVFTPADQLEPTPVVLMIHGGGWRGGKRQQMTSAARRLTDRGFAVVNVSYRFAPEHIWPAQRDDMEAALQWIADNADTYNFDTDRIATFGYSAGAHLALMLAYHPDRDKPGAVQVAAVAGGGSPVDLTRWPKGELVVQFIGYPYETHSHLYYDASPLHYVREGLPPTYLYHGLNDWIVEVQQSRTLDQALDQVGVPHHYDEGFWGHVATFLFDGKEIDRVGEFFQRSFEQDASQPAAVAGNR